MTVNLLIRMNHDSLLGTESQTSENLENHYHSNTSGYGPDMRFNLILCLDDLPEFINHIQAQSKVVKCKYIRQFFKCVVISTCNKLTYI